MVGNPSHGIFEKPLTPTMEDYLEAIFRLTEEKKVVRVKNIAKRLGVKMPTVTNMLKTLGERGFIDYVKHEYLELTEKGRMVGEEIYRRHHTIRSFLTDILGVDASVADEEACKMEHGMSSDTLKRLIKFMDFVHSCPRAGSSWLAYFDEYRKHGRRAEECLVRMEEFSNGYRKSVEP